MSENKFDPRKLKKLNNPQRLLDIPPAFIQSKLTVEKPGVLVDIGAGTGFFSIAFLRQFNASRLYACDMSETMLDWMKEHVASKHPGIIPVKSEENCLPIDDAVADLVFMIALHHELENPSALLEEAYRVLKPGGEIFIADWKKGDTVQGPPQAIRCSPRQVRDQLMESKFSEVRTFDDLPTHFLVVGKKGQ